MMMPGRFSKTPSSSPILSFVFCFLFLARCLVYLWEALRLVTVTVTLVVSKQLKTLLVNWPVSLNNKSISLLDKFSFKEILLILFIKLTCIFRTRVS